MKYALVTLMGFQKPDPQQQSKFPPPLHKSTQAGVAGEFQFHGLGKANYNVSVQKPGFNMSFSPNDLKLRQLDLTASVSGIELKLSPLGVIEGKVVDQNDEPMRGVNILALQVQIDDGQRDTNAPRSVATDDRGMYRLWNLQPGHYYIKAAGKSGGTYRYVGDSTPYYSSWQSFTPVYFGGGQTLDSATPILIEPGAKAAADFHLNLESAYRIRGTLANAPSGTITFELLQGIEDISASRTSLNATTGKFEVQDVTPGNYTLRATQEGKMRGETTVTVSDRDVSEVSIALSPAVAVQGVVRVLGAPLKAKHLPGFDQARAAAADADKEEIDAMSDQDIEANCNVSLHARAGGARSQSTPARRMRNAAGVQENGSFTIPDVLPGLYTVRLQCYGGYPTSALSGGIDLLANPNLTIQPGSAPAPIEIQLKRGGGTLNGEFAVNPIPKTAGVLLVPAFNSTGPTMLPVGIDFESQDKVHFGQMFLAPGDYTAYAFSEWQQVEFRNPGFLQTLSGGESVRIEDGKEQKVSITKVVK